MKNITTQLEQYVQKCDEVYLSSHLQNILKKASLNVSQINVKKLKKLLQKKIVLLDVREPEEFASGYINAQTVLTIPRGKLEFVAIEKIAKQFGQDQLIVTYCLKGPRGLLAAYQLQKLGFTNVYNLEGGILQWLAKGNSIRNYLGEMKLVS